MNKLFLLTLFFVFSIIPAFSLEYDFSDTDSVKIPIKITENATTALRNKSHEGQCLNFLVSNDVYYKSKLLVREGTLVTARLEIIVTRGFAGMPGEIFVTDFSIPGLDSNKIIQPISKRGFSTTALILPIKWALTPFPPFGSLTNIMIGGNAKIKPRQTLYLKYYPNYRIN